MSITNPIMKTSIKVVQCQNLKNHENIKIKKNYKLFAKKRASKSDLLLQVLI